MLSEKRVRFLTKIIALIFTAIFSFTVLASRVPKTEFIQTSIENIDDSKTTVMEFTGAALAASLAITALPDDFGSSLADTLSEMNNYFVIILTALFLERIIAVNGVGIAFTYMIPAACMLGILGLVFRRNFLKDLGVRLSILAIALVLVVPCSTHLSKAVGAEYLSYVDSTIEETENGSEKINELQGSGDADSSFLEKLSDAIKTAINSVSDLLNYFNNIIKKCINSIAILMVTNILIPVLTLIFFWWLTKQLFHVDLSAYVLRFPRRKKADREEEE